jgi:hypothetical protein
MWTRLVCLLLVLGAVSGCRSVNQICFPGDRGQMGPNDFDSWELRKDLERSEHVHDMSSVRNPWDEWW